MALHNRRVIYIDDDTWAALDEEASERKTTISAVVRHALQMQLHPRDQAWSKANQTVPLAEREVTWDRHKGGKPRLPIT